MLNYEEMTTSQLQQTYEALSGQLDGAQRVLRSAKMEVEQMELDMMYLCGEMMRRVDEGQKAVS